MPTIKFNYADRQLSLPNKKQLKAFIASIFQKEAVQLSSLNYIFCSDEFILDINKSHLQHDYYTDIITFPLQEEGEAVEGEIYISLERVADNAIKENQPLINETLRVLFHGALHLCGYKDKTKNEIATMRQKEDYYIQTYLNQPS